MNISVKNGAIIRVRTKSNNQYTGKVMWIISGEIALLPQLLLSMNVVGNYGIDADGLVPDCTADALIPPVYVDMGEIESWEYFTIPNMDTHPDSRYYGLRFIGDVPKDRRNYYEKNPDINPYCYVCVG